MRELTELGLQPAIAEISIETASLSYYNKFGQKIWSHWQAKMGKLESKVWNRTALYRQVSQLGKRSGCASNGLKNLG
jgi:hypothetical protein